MIDITKDEKSILEDLVAVYGEEGTYPADYLYIFGE